MAALDPRAFAAGNTPVVANVASVPLGTAPAVGELEVLIVHAGSFSSLLDITPPVDWSGGIITNPNEPSKLYRFWRAAEIGSAATVDLTVIYASQVDWGYARYSPPAAPAAPIITTLAARATLTTPTVADAPPGATWLGFWYYDRGFVGAPAWTPPIGGTARASAHTGSAPWYSPFVADGLASGTVPALTADPGQVNDGGAERFACIIVLGEGAPDPARIRSQVSEDAGSIFQATQAVAVELGVSEAFPYGSDVPAGVLRAFHEALTPGEAAIRYYPLPTRNQEMLVTVDGETNLGRLARVYPEALMLPAASIPGESGGVVTAQQAIQHVLNSWSSAHPWLLFEPVPDLRMLEPGAVSDPRQYYVDNASAGILTTAAVVIPQDGTDRRSMRDILDEWLSIFPGTIVRQTSGGTIELVPRVGPDAPEDPAVTLTWRDLIAISEGDPDPRGVINRARVTSQGWEFTDNQTLRPPAFVVSIGGLGIDRSVLDGEEVIPDDAEEFQPWHTIPFTVLVDGGNNVTVNVSITAFGSWNRTTASAFSTEGTASPSVTLAVGQSAEVSITHTSRALSVTATWRLTRVSSVAIGVEPVSVPSYAENPLGRTYLAYLLEFDIVGTAWVRSNESVTSEFGQDGVGIPADGGGDAIADSRAQYGERLAQLQSNIFQLTPEQAQAIAQSYVLWNINPRTIRDVQQSEWNRYPVKFDHIGRYVELPTGEVAVVENRSYSDAFAPGGGMMQSAFTATVTETVIDTSTDWLLLDNGDFFQLDSGDLVEVS